MADIEVVIHIPEWKYKSICEGMEASKRCGVVGIDHNIHEAIANGTPLPKGHGDLKDVSNLKNTIHEKSFNSGMMNPIFTYAEIMNMIDATPTIIEADKAESEG